MTSPLFLLLHSVILRGRQDGMGHLQSMMTVPIPITTTATTPTMTTVLISVPSESSNIHYVLRTEYENNRVYEM
ncbi:hypothetical protein F5X96DRAFT_613590 [Biscogniauxia mediterranea]|nr:hypothetical protein F5X96DRAFT_613590 [Biscogniauxia mediterranea]